MHILIYCNQKRRGCTKKITSNIPIQVNCLRYQPASNYQECWLNNHKSTFFMVYTTHKIGDLGDGLWHCLNHIM